MIILKVEGQNSETGLWDCIEEIRNFDLEETKTFFGLRLSVTETRPHADVRNEARLIAENHMTSEDIMTNIKLKLKQFLSVRLIEYPNVIICNLSVFFGSDSLWLGESKMIWTNGKWIQ